MYFNIWSGICVTPTFMGGIGGRRKVEVRVRPILPCVQLLLIDETYQSLAGGLADLRQQRPTVTSPDVRYAMKLTAVGQRQTRMEAGLPAPLLMLVEIFEGGQQVFAVLAKVSAGPQCDVVPTPGHARHARCGNVLQCQRAVVPYIPTCSCAVMPTRQQRGADMRMNTLSVPRNM